MDTSQGCAASQNGIDFLNAKKQIETLELAIKVNIYFIMIGNLNRETDITNIVID